MTCITRGIVIKKGHSGDFDRQYVIYTSDLGKISAIAKGAKKASSKLSPHLEIFYSVELMLAKSTVFYRVAGAKIDNSHRSIKSSLVKTAVSLLFSEALDNLMIYDFPDRRVFEISEDFFRGIDSAKSMGEVLAKLNKGLFGLLSHSGYQPEIKSVSQRQLAAELCRAVINVTEKELRSYNFLCQLLKAIKISSSEEAGRICFNA